jgi:excinuclease ABC subunit B
VILYADKRTDSMEGAIAEMERRRVKQRAHNEEHGITPKTVVKAVRELLDIPQDDDTTGKVGRKGRKSAEARSKKQAGDAPSAPSPRRQFASKLELGQHLKGLRAEMLAAAKNLDFELAAQIRDEVFRLEKLEMELL